MRLRPGAVPPPGQGVALDPLAVVRAAMAGEPVATDQPKRRMAGGEFSVTTVSPALRKLGVLYAVYLCYNSLRVQEVITLLAIPKLPMLMSLVLAAGLVLGVPASGWQLLWQKTPALRWQAVLTALAIITVPLGIWMAQSFQRLWPNYFIVVTLFVAGVVVLRDRVVLVRTLQILTGVLALIATLVFLGVGAGSVGSLGRLTVGSLDPNDYAWILATFVPIALWLGVRKKSTSFLWFGVAALLTLGIVPTQSRGGFLALLSGAMVLIFFGAQGWRRVFMFVTLGVLGVALLAYIDATGASRLTDFSGYEGGTGRTDMWKKGIRWMFERPWGYGMGNFSTHNTLMTRSGLAVHSSYIAIGFDLGVFGGISYLAMWFGGLRGVYRTRRTALAAHQSSLAKEEASMAGFLLASLVANAVGAAFLDMQYAGLTLFMLSLGPAIVLGFPADRLQNRPAEGSMSSNVHGRSVRQGSLLTSGAPVRGRRVPG